MGNVTKYQLAAGNSGITMPIITDNRSNSALVNTDAHGYNPTRYIQQNQIHSKSSTVLMTNAEIDGGGTVNASLGDVSMPDGGILGGRGLRGGDLHGAEDGEGADGMFRTASHKSIDGNVRDVQPVHIPLEFSAEGEIHATKPEVWLLLLVGQSQPQHQNGLIHGL